MNRDTIALMQDLFAVCEAHPHADSAQLKSSVADLRERERSQCDFLVRRACAFREAMREQSLGSMGLARISQTSTTTGSLLESLPRHAAAVFLAVGLLNCNGKGALRTTHDGSASDSSAAADSKGVADATTYKDQGGMFEAPPPPMDAPIVPDASVPDISSADGSIDTGSDAGATKDATAIADAFVFKDQGGMFEAPPPPADASLVRRDVSKD